MRNRLNGGLLAACAATALLSARVVCGQTLFSDGFESYNNGLLATSDSGTANPGPNGGPGNPWWGPYTGNEFVTGAANGVTPHSGSKMIMGEATADFDQDSYNIAHRDGGNAPITGNISLDFWFYDAKGAGDANSTGYGELGYYDGVPSNTDYNSALAGGNTLAFSSQIQRIILGTSDNTGANLAVYQARLLGDSTPIVGTAYGSNYINTIIPRTVGWHEGTIDVGPQLGAGGNNVNFYIDGILAASATTSFNYGYNVIVMDAQEANNSSTINYFDDVTLSSVPEPSSLLLLVGLPCILRRRARR